MNARLSRYRCSECGKSNYQTRDPDVPVHTIYCIECDEETPHTR